MKTQVIEIQGENFRVPSFTHKRELRGALKTATQIVTTNNAHKNNSAQARVQRLIDNSAFRNAADRITEHCSFKIGNSYAPLDTEDAQERAFGNDPTIPLLLTLRVLSTCRT